MRGIMRPICASISSQNLPKAFSGISLTANSRGAIFKTLGEREASLALEQLVEQVLAGAGRIEIVGKNDASVCVLLSKVELQGLEQALSILSATTGSQAMRAQLNAIATSVNASFELPIRAV